MPDQTRSKSRRRWVRISVRGLMVLIVVIGAGLGWVVRRLAKSSATRWPRFEDTAGSSVMTAKRG